MPLWPLEIIQYNLLVEYTYSIHIFSPAAIFPRYFKNKSENCGGKFCPTAGYGPVFQYLKQTCHKSAHNGNFSIIEVHVPGFLELENKPTYTKLQTTKLHVYCRQKNKITTWFQSISLMFGRALGFIVTCTLRTFICTFVILIKIKCRIYVWLVCFDFCI